MKKDEEVRSKEELEAKLLKVRSEIQWRERELEESIKGDALPYLIVFTPAAFFLPLYVWFGEVIGFIIAIVLSIILIVIIQKRYWKSKEHKKFQKAKRELKELRKRKTELEKKLDNLVELLKISKRSHKGKIIKKIG